MKIREFDVRMREECLAEVEPGKVSFLFKCLIVFFYFNGKTNDQKVVLIKDNNWVIVSKTLN